MYIIEQATFDKEHDCCSYQVKKRFEDADEAIKYFEYLTIERGLALQLYFAGTYWYNYNQYWRKEHSKSTGYAYPFRVKGNCSFN